MKFLCDRCKTRYSIGDERVRGKILKIRCKNCANVITVREGMTDADASGAPRRNHPTQAVPIADQMAAVPAANGAGAAQPKSALGAAFASAMTKQPPPAALEEEWYVSIDGEQSGPFSLSEAQRWVGTKAFDADLHCWSEGFDDWLPVDKVSHFRGLRKKPAPPAMPPPLPPSRTGPSRAITAAPARAAQAAAMTQQHPEEEPKALFAATMASLEKSAPMAANGGAQRPAMAAGMAVEPRSSLVEPRSSLVEPRSSLVEPRTNGTGARTAIPVPALPRTLPAAKSAPTAKGVGLRPVGKPALGFDGSDGATQESHAFADESPTMAAPDEMRRLAVQSNARPDADVTARPADSPNGEAFVAALASVRDADPKPVKQRSLSSLLDGWETGSHDARPDTARPDTSSQTAPNDAFFDRLGANQLKSEAATAPAAMSAEPEADDLDIGEVSRVVNLADLAKSAPKANRTGSVHKVTGSVGKLTGAVPKIGINGSPSGKLNSTAPVPLIDAVETVPSGQIADVPLEAIAPLVATTHRRGMIALIIGALILIGAAVLVVVFVVDGGNEVTSLGSDYDYNGQRADPTHLPGDPPTVGSNEPPPNPFIPRPVPRPRPNPNPGSAKVTLDPPLGNTIKGDEVETMARNSSGTTTACFRRADKGADAIRLADIKKIGVTFHINPDGSVQGNSISLSDNTSQVLTSCLQRMIGGWKFRANAGSDFKFVFAKPE